MTDEFPYLSKSIYLLFSYFVERRIKPYYFFYSHGYYSHCLLLLLIAPFLSSLSSCRAASTDISDPLSPLLPIVHRLWQVFRVTSRILRELLYVCSSWSSCFCSAICGRPWEYITYELVPACLVCLTLIVFVMGGWWPYSWCLVGVTSRIVFIHSIVPFIIFLVFFRSKYLVF